MNYENETILLRNERIDALKNDLNSILDFYYEKSLDNEEIFIDS